MNCSCQKAATFCFIVNLPGTIESKNCLTRSSLGSKCVTPAGKAIDVTCFKMLFWHSLGKSEENSKILNQYLNHESLVYSSGALQWNNHPLL